MDPDVALREMRDALKRVDTLDGDLADNAREDVCEHARALDEWLSKGGFLPSEWQPRTYTQWVNITTSDGTG